MHIIKCSDSFDSAHFLSGYDGKCKNIHGHRWSVEVEICAKNLQESGDKRGMVSDFGDVKRDLKAITDRFDHALIIEEKTLKKNTVKALEEEGFKLVFVAFRTTAEEFSKFFYDEMKGKGYNITCATVYETPNNCSSYDGCCI